MNVVGLPSPQGTLLPKSAGGVPHAEVQLLLGHCDGGAPAARELAKLSQSCRCICCYADDEESSWHTPSETDSDYEPDMPGTEGAAAHPGPTAQRRADALPAARWASQNCR